MFQGIEETSKQNSQKFLFLRDTKKVGWKPWVGIYKKGHYREAKLNLELGRGLRGPTPATE